MRVMSTQTRGLCDARVCTGWNVMWMWAVEASSYLGHGEYGKSTKGAQHDARSRHDRSANDARTSAVPL